MNDINKTEENIAGDVTEMAVAINEVIGIFITQKGLSPLVAGAGAIIAAAVPLGYMTAVGVSQDAIDKTIDAAFNDLKANIQVNAAMIREEIDGGVLEELQ